MKYFIDDKIMSDQRSLCVSSVTQFISIIAVILSVVKTGRGVSIYNNTDKNNFICGDSVTLSCNIDPIPVFGMSWSLDGIRIAVCVSGSCTKDPASPLYINYVVGGGNKIYNLTIDAVTTVMDATIFSCNDLSSTQDTIQLNVAVPIVSGDVSITDTLSAMHGNISVTTECVFPHNKEDFDIEFLTSQNMLVGNHVDITEYFEEGSACSKSSGCDGKHVTIYIGFTERNDAVATTIYAKIVHSGVVINTVPTTNVYRIVPCNSSQSFCDHRKLCVNKCNNITDCNDGSDEQNCSPTTETPTTPGWCEEHRAVCGGVIAVDCLAGVCVIIIIIIIIIFLLCFRPGPPTNLTSNWKDRCAKLTWDAPASKSFGDIKGYIIENKERDSGKWKQCMISQDKKATFTVANLDEVRVVSFRVKAVNVHGVSNPTVKCRFSLPAAPYDLQCKRNGQCVELLWKIPALNGCQHKTEQYIIEKMTNNEKWIRYTIYPVPYTKFTVTGVDDHMVQFRVKAVNKIGESEPSRFPIEHNYIAARVIADSDKNRGRRPELTINPPSAPSDLIYDTKGGCLNWTMQAYADTIGNGTQCSGFVIEKKCNSGNWNRCHYKPVTETIVPVNDLDYLDDGLDVKFRVKAVNYVGESQPSNTVSCTITNTNRHPRRKTEQSVFSFNYEDEWVNSPDPKTGKLFATKRVSPTGSQEKEHTREQPGRKRQRGSDDLEPSSRRNKNKTDSKIQSTSM